MSYIPHKVIRDDYTVI